MGVSVIVAATILSVIAGFSMMGRLSAGFISDRIGGRLTLSACLFASVLALIWLLFAEEIWMFYLFAVLFGVSDGGLTILRTVV